MHSSQCATCPPITFNMAEYFDSAAILSRFLSWLRSVKLIQELSVQPFPTLTGWCTRLPACCERTSAGWQRQYASVGRAWHCRCLQHRALGLYAHTAGTQHCWQLSSKAPTKKIPIRHVDRWNCELTNQSLNDQRVYSVTKTKDFSKLYVIMNHSCKENQMWGFA